MSAGDDTAPPAEGDRCPATGVVWDDKRARAAILRALHAIDADFSEIDAANDILSRLRGDEHLVGDRSLRIAREHRAAAGPRAGDTAPREVRQGSTDLDRDIRRVQLLLTISPVEARGPVERVLAELDRLRSEVAALRGMRDAGNALAAEVLDLDAMPVWTSDAWAELVRTAQGWRSAAGGAP